MPLEIAWAYTDSWLAGDIICKLMLSLRTFGFYLSSSVLITITIDRYYVILYPMKMEKINKLSKILLYVCWIFSFISSIPQVFNYQI
jgi:gonadotropin-releasing hormone receptor